MTDTRVELPILVYLVEDGVHVARSLITGTSAVHGCVEQALEDVYRLMEGEVDDALAQGELDAIKHLSVAAGRRMRLQLRALRAGSRDVLPVHALRVLFARLPVGRIVRQSKHAGDHAGVRVRVVM
jgi:hypothetical protein